MATPHSDPVLGHADEGHGLPVVLLHAFAMDHAQWAPQRGALAAQCRLILPTLRGFHGSPPTDGGAVSMDEYADEVVALMDRLAIRRAVVGGISLGGYVALSLALRHPQRTAGLVLSNTRATADSPEGTRLREAMVRDILARGPAAVVESYGDKPFGPDCPGDAKARAREMILRQPAAGLVSGTRGMAGRPDRSAALGAIRVPTLVIGGTHDPYSPSPEGEAMHRAIAGSRYVEIPRAGHLSNLDSPDAFNDAVRGFLRTVAP